MRISSISPVGRSMSSPVDPISWFEASSGVRAIHFQAPLERGAFQRVLLALQEEKAHTCRTRVLEVVSAPGFKPGFVRFHRGAWRPR